MGIHKRAEPFEVTELRPDACTNPRLQRLLDGLGPGQDFNALIPHADGDGLREIGGPGAPNHEQVDLLVIEGYFLVGQDARARYLQEVRRRRTLANIALIIVMAFQQMLETIARQVVHQIVIKAVNFVSDALKTTTCEEGEDAPACIDSDCNGDKNGVCTAPEKPGCKCLEILYISSGNPYDEAQLDLQQMLLTSINPPKTSVKDSIPNCNGIATQNWIQRDIGSLAIEKYCNAQGFTVQAGKKSEGTYNSGVDQVFISTGFRAEASLDPEECKILLYKVLDGCDGGTLDNPGNWKHGGSIEHPKGATISFIPQGSPKPYCNPHGSPPGSAPWVDIGVGADAVQRVISCAIRSVPFAYVATV